MSSLRAGVVVLLALAWLAPTVNAGSALGDCVYIWYEAAGEGLGVSTGLHDMIYLKLSTDIPGEGMASTVGIIPSACGASGLPILQAAPLAQAPETPEAEVLLILA